MSSRPRIYTVHVRAWSSAADREAVFLREGFSWGAFFFSVLWALWHRLWFWAVIVLGISAAIAVAGGLVGLDPVTDGAIGLALALLIGWEANDWRRRALEKRGFVTAGVVAAPSLVEAERRFFSKSPTSASRVAGPSLSAPHFVQRLAGGGGRGEVGAFLP
jgi:hypothetical protein